MPTGTVRWLSKEKGYGFIAADGGSKDVFVQVSAFQDAGLAAVKEGDKVQFALVIGANGKVAADRLWAIEPRRTQA